MDYLIFSAICLFILVIGVRYVMQGLKQGNNRVLLEVGLWAFFFVVLILNAWAGWF